MFEINYDTRPYLPDIFIKDNIYNSFDAINNNNNIPINSTIFIFNINEPTESIYNDPGYLLFGKKKNIDIEYKYPSLNFFYNNNVSNVLPYVPITKINSINLSIKELLENIGYDIRNINPYEFEYQELIAIESINNIKKKVIYLYFNLNNYISNSVNYNNYLSTIYYKNQYWNILIYPFYNASEYSLINNNKIYLEIKENKTKNYLKTIDFDDREIIKYYQKIDYKYFENTNYTMNNNSKMETIRNYSFNIKNYVNFIDKKKDESIINISLNEISKVYYYKPDYENKYNNTYTDIILNNNHINNNKIYSNVNNKYSYTSDNKMSNLNKININNKKYSGYNFDTETNPTTYQQVKNYYLNTYIDVLEITISNKLIKLNAYLLKIFLIINPLIINGNYLINNVTTKIYPLYKDTNILEFGNNIDKLNLYISGDFTKTDVYYINKFKIIFEFSENNLTFSYIIILGIAFYNNLNIDLLELSKTFNSEDLAYVNYTNLEESITLSPTINNFKNLLKIYEIMTNFNIKKIIKYNFTLDYKYLSQYSNLKSFINFINFYNLIPNILTPLKTTDNKYYNNVYNILMLKVNNYIKNFINVENNYLNFINEDINKNYINITTLYDQNIINNGLDNIKYIEYYNNFPKIDNKYLTVEENFICKYNQVLLYPYNKINISLFEILPSGKYIKFNFINLKSIYHLVDLNFVKSIKRLDILNYNFSLFILLPYNINQDNSFYCTNPKYYWDSNYSMNIGGNLTYTYLVLTDNQGNPYTFYGESSNLIENKVNGIIYGIKLYNYTNYFSENLYLEVKLNLYINNYLNLSQLIILIESYNTYSDLNNVLWNINQSILKLHNFNFLKEIVLYDFKRFSNKYNLKLITEEYIKFNYRNLKLLSDNKIELNNLRYGVKIVIYISNLFKIILLLQKCISYLEIIIVNIMINDYNNDLLINIIKYNIGIISNLLEINYNLCITSGTFNSVIYDELSQIYLIDINNTLENINNYQKYCKYILNYSKKKIISVLDFLVIVNENNIYYNLYFNLYHLISNEFINNLLGNEIINDINNFTETISDSLLDFKNLNNNLLLKQINACLLSIAYNSTKIDELYNFIKLIADNSVNENLPETINLNVVKNDYIYDTTCYTIESNVPKFNIINFLNDTIILINKLSIETNDLEYKIYQKSILEGIIIYIENTINYFIIIINKIVYIYSYLKELPGPSINIYDPIEIGLFYNVLGLFRDNYINFFNVLYGNKINKFYEYDNLKITFDNLFYSCQEFLFYIKLKIDFKNDNTISNTNLFVNEDLYKIIKKDTFYNFIIKTINNIDNLLINNKSEILLIYLEKIKHILKINTNINIKKIIIIIIDKMLLEIKKNIEDNNNQLNLIDYGSYYIIPYQDLILFKSKFNWSSFNFNKFVLKIIFSINQLNETIFKNYYTDPEVTNFYKEVLNYTYLTTPYKYINLNNDIINS